jgi:hypothetical protein
VAVDFSDELHRVDHGAWVARPQTIRQPIGINARECERQAAGS